MTFDIIPQNLSITAMRASGYKDTAHALAELVDNSIQSGTENFGTTSVEVICVDRAPEVGGRTRIANIAVMDDAAGMDANALRAALQFGNGSHLEAKSQKGIGKFGMGLPNSSISQCKKVEVWSWRKGKVLYCHLDVKAIEDRKMTLVPEPVPAVLPAPWLSMFAGKVGDHGTLVVWSVLDRVTWKQSKTLLEHTEFIVGRVYRKFIQRGQARIRLASYQQLADGSLVPGVNSQVRPNDPLYLMAPSNSPDPYNLKPAFEKQIETSIKIGFRGREHEVRIVASACFPEVRLGGGDKPIGRHARKNLGVSVVRADRELELNRSFENTYDPRERWWGIEVQFEPELDDVFGVTNNKQAAINFMPRDLKSDAESEGMTEAQFQNVLEADQDPRMPMYLITAEISKMLTRLRKLIRGMKEAEKVKSQVDTIGTATEIAATETVKKRRAYYGDTGKSDKQESDDAADRKQALTLKLESDGTAHELAEQIAVQYVEKALKYRFRRADLAGSGFFEVELVGGLILITINTNHPVCDHLFGDLQMEEGESHEATNDPFVQKLLLLLAAWGRMEDEANSERLRTHMVDMRNNWGTLSRDFFEDEEV